MIESGVGKGERTPPAKQSARVFELKIQLEHANVARNSVTFRANEQGRRTAPPISSCPPTFPLSALFASDFAYQRFAVQYTLSVADGLERLMALPPPNLRSQLVRGLRVISSFWSSSSHVAISHRGGECAENTD